MKTKKKSICNLEEEKIEDERATRGLCRSVADFLGRDEPVTEAEAAKYLTDMTFSEAMTGDEMMESLKDVFYKG